MSVEDTITRAVTVLEGATDKIARVDGKLDQLGIDVRLQGERLATATKTLDDHEQRLRDMHTSVIRLLVIGGAATVLAAAALSRVLGALLP